MKPKFCAICKQQVNPIEEKILIEKHCGKSTKYINMNVFCLCSVHKNCFNCAICGTSLMVGNCSFDDVLYHYFGPLWFCPAHMMLGSGEKFEKLKAKYGDPEVGTGIGGSQQQKSGSSGKK